MITTERRRADHVDTHHHCVVCGYDFTVIDQPPGSLVEHRCPTRVAGPVWLVTEPCGARR